MPRIDWPASLRQKRQAPWQLAHLRYRPQAAGQMVLHLVLLDQSASMLKGEKLARAKGYVLALGEAVYRRREIWGVLGFSGMGLQWLQRPGKSGVHNRAWISALGGGGGTPLQAALHAATDMQKRIHKQQLGQSTVCCLWLISDGRFLEQPPRPAAMQGVVVVDAESERVALGRCQQLAQAWQADYQSLF